MQEVVVPSGGIVTCQRRLLCLFAVPRALPVADSSAPLAWSFGPITLPSCCTQAPSLPDGTNPIHAILASLPGPRPASCTAELALENAFAITTHGSSRNKHLHAQCNDHGLRCRYVMAAQYVERAAFLLAPQRTA